MTPASAGTLNPPSPSPSAAGWRAESLPAAAARQGPGADAACMKAALPSRAMKETPTIADSHDCRRGPETNQLRWTDPACELQNISHGAWAVGCFWGHVMQESFPCGATLAAN